MTPSSCDITMTERVKRQHTKNERFQLNMFCYLPIESCSPSQQALYLIPHFSTMNDDDADQPMKNDDEPAEESSVRSRRSTRKRRADDSDADSIALSAKKRPTKRPKEGDNSPKATAKKARATKKAAPIALNAKTDKNEAAAAVAATAPVSTQQMHVTQQQQPQLHDGYNTNNNETPLTGVVPKQKNSKKKPDSDIPPSEILLPAAAVPDNNNWVPNLNNRDNTNTFISNGMAIQEIPSQVSAVETRPLETLTTIQDISDVAYTHVDQVPPKQLQFPLYGLLLCGFAFLLLLFAYRDWVKLLFMAPMVYASDAIVSLLPTPSTQVTLAQQQQTLLVSKLQELDQAAAAVKQATAQAAHYEHWIRSEGVMFAAKAGEAIEVIMEQLQPLEVALELLQQQSPVPPMDEIKAALGHDARYLLDLAFLETWRIPQSQCNKPPLVDKNMNNTTNEQLLALLATLQQQALDSVAMIQQASSSLEYKATIGRRLLERTRQELAQLKVLMTVRGNATADSIHDIHQQLVHRVELERADHFGRVDYASVLYGARVVRERTSAALKDQLPVLNRVADLLGVRFYGHGPEAALSPSRNTNDNAPLGQCWAVLAPATLTVELAMPIYVSHIVVEHPTQEVTNRIRTAPQEFSVYGYKHADDKDASTPMELASKLVYQIGGPTRQVFAVQPSVPPSLVRSVQMVIHSNWGDAYTCLYRVRVFGSRENVSV
jgi:hypothetical protein